MNKFRIFRLNFIGGMSKMRYLRNKSLKIAKRWGISVPLNLLLWWPKVA